MYDTCMLLIPFDDENNFHSEVSKDLKQGAIHMSLSIGRLH